MAIQLFQPQYRAIQNPIDLNTLANTYNTLEKGHQAAVAQTAAYKQALNELDLNEAEDAWVVQRQQQIQDAFNNNLIYGNAAAAVDDIVKTYGDITADAGMKGRLRAQQDYKTYIANLDNNQTLDEDTKEYFKEKNKYYYQDKYDNAGNIIGGTKWKPIEKEVDHIPLNMIFEQALKWAAKENGGSNSIKFLDANGQPTDDYSKSVTGEMHVNIGGKWDKLSKEKVKSAIDAAIKSIPGAQASLAQDYKIAKWKYDNGKASDITDKNGYVMNAEEYLNNKINPFVQAVTYHNYTSAITYGNAWKSQLAYNQLKDAQQGLGINQNNFKIGDITTFRSNPIMIENNSPIEAQGAITADRQDLSNLLQKYNSDLHLDLSKADNNTIYKAITDNITDNEDLATAISLYHDIVDNMSYISSIIEGKDKDDIEDFEAYNAIQSMSDFNKETDATKGYTSILNYAYGDGIGVRQYFNEDEFIAFKNAIGDNNLEKYGIIANQVGNNYYVELPKSNEKSFYIFSKAVEDAKDNLFNEALDVAAGLFTNSRRNGFYRINSDGSESRLDDNLEMGKFWQLEPVIYMANPTNAAVSYVNSLSKASNRILNGGEMAISNIAIAEPTPRMAELASLIQSDPEMASKYKTQYDQKAKEIDIALRNGIDMTQANGYILDEETNIFRKMDSEERMEYTKQLRSLDSSSKIISAIVRDPITGGVAVQITIPGKTKDGEVSVSPKTFIAGSGSITDPVLKEWEQDSMWKAETKMENYYNSKRPISLTNNEAFNGITKIKLNPTTYGFDVINTINNTIVNSIDKSTASTIMDILSQWEQACAYANAGGQYNETRMINTIKQTAKILCDVNNLNYDYISYFETILANNIKR